MKCPGCGATVEDGADLCLECGEPMGDSPAARVARAEAAAKADPGTDPGNVIRPPADLFKSQKPVSAPTKPATTAPAAPAAKPAAPAAKPVTPTTPPTKKWRTEEPEPRRCPGCGTKTFAVRCPGCGTKLIHDDE